MLEWELNKNFINLNGKRYDHEIQIMVDVRTGINYLYMRNGAICPRYNTDGTFMVTPSHEITELVSHATKEAKATNYI
ncbi:DUF6440 family protein [Pseudoflavonifractor sp. An176]|uniref:DUF6440 family protein n=1 Tax=Pseudoflavonifractor sp. An176 TaxID=1965572 RepID=UPI00117B01BF|nr:DUF6440 family protein [Pseudoflavonifractor sp. An176]